MNKFTIDETAAGSICNRIEDQLNRLGDIAVLLDAASVHVGDIGSDGDSSDPRQHTGSDATRRVHVLMGLASQLIESGAADLASAHADMLRQIKFGRTVLS